MALTATPAPYSRQRPPDRLTRGSRGVPATVTVRATLVADLQDEIAALAAEGTDFATDVRAHALRVHMAAQCDRLDIAAHEAAAIVDAADRHLRQRGSAA